MGELIFIGLGLHDEYGISMRGLREAQSCDLLFLELYTSVMPGLNLKSLRKIIGKPARVLSRSSVEEEAEKVILTEAKRCKVGFLVPGDPMVATTHLDLRLRAEKAGVKTSIVHGASVVTAAAGVCGLQSYKFGRTVTIPVSSRSRFPESVYLSVKSNLDMGLHSLILLEVDAESGAWIGIPEAVRLLLEYARTRSDNIFRADKLGIGVARIGAPDMRVVAARAEELPGIDFGRSPHVLIFPGNLHFMEDEAVRMLTAPRS